MSAMILPIVHLNGTSREELIRLRCDAAQKIREALHALAEMAPNGRDYYPWPGMFEKARAQHERRAASLRYLYEEIEQEYLALDQGAQ